VATGNGFEALSCLRQHNTFDLVISDVDMPIMNGIELHRHLDEEFPGLKLVFLTASNVARLDAVGAPILSKDWPLTRILEMIAFYLGVSHQVDAGETFSKMGRW
jgi:CheY-like chemotaxis protein